MPNCKTIKRLIPATCAWVLLITTSTLFFVYPCRRLLEEFPVYIAIAQGIITFFVISNFFCTTIVDPGIIKRANVDEDKDDFRAPLYKEVQVKNVTIRMKWCATCQFYRPPRCSHCSVCDNCIETFDHHCPWVNNCIGHRNYRHFFFFLIFLTLHMITIFIWCLIFVLKNKNNMQDTAVVISIVLMIIITVFFIPIFGLAGFHIILVARGRTTNEQVTGKFQGASNPFSRGMILNCLYTLCGPRYPGLHEQKNFVEANPDNSVKVYMDNIPMDFQAIPTEANYKYSANNSDFKDIKLDRLDNKISFQSEYAIRQSSNEQLSERPYNQDIQISSDVSEFNGPNGFNKTNDGKHVVTMQHTENGTKETTFIALSAPFLFNSEKTSTNDRPAIFPHYNNKISASPSKSTSINEISTHLKRSPIKKYDSQGGPEGGMVIYYSPDAGCLSNTNMKFNSETELQKFDNFDDLPERLNYATPEKFVKKSVPFMKALEMTNKLDNFNAEQNKTIQKKESSDSRKSQYEMNYEISV